MVVHQQVNLLNFGDMMDNSANKFCNDYGNIQHDNLPTCNCCPFGYHIDLGFLQYVESLANFEPSDGELLRRDKRRSRLSKEFMLGMEDLFILRSSYKAHPEQEILFECETELSPKTENLTHEELYGYPFSNNNNNNNNRRTNSLTETTAFVHDALDDVVSDFELTLERTKKKNKKRQIFSWISDDDAIACSLDRNVPDSAKFQYLELTKSDLQPNTINRDTTKEVFEIFGTNENYAHRQSPLNHENIQKWQEDEDLSILRNPVNSTSRAENIRPSHSIDSGPPTPPKRVSSVRAANQFTPQRISPVLLECLSSRLLPNPPKISNEQPIEKQVITRDVSTMCDQITPVIKANRNSVIQRSIGTSPVQTFGIHDIIYTKSEVDEIVRQTLQLQAEEFHKTLAKNTEMMKLETSAKQKVFNVKSVQTIPEKVIQKVSQSVMVRPQTKDVGITIVPKTRSVASSDHKISDLVCDKCISDIFAKSSEKLDKKSVSSISLNQMDAIPVCLTNSFEEKHKKKLKIKNVGTQYKLEANEIGTQCAVQMSSISIQNSPICLTKSSQYMCMNASKQTETNGLVNFNSIYTMTDNIPLEIPTKCAKCQEDENKPTLNKTSQNLVRTRDSGTNPDKIRTREFGTNPDKLRTREFGTDTFKNMESKSVSSNTETILKRDKACGELMKPHISISCADNYCDSCKDAIKVLAKNFTKVLSNPVLLNGNPEQSKIPRPITIPSPVPNRKVLMRQSTYTLDSPPPESPSKQTDIIKCLDLQNEAAENLEKKATTSNTSAEETGSSAINLKALTNSTTFSNNEEYLNKPQIICKSDNSPLANYKMKDGLTATTEVIQNDGTTIEKPSSESFKSKTTTIPPPNMILNDTINTTTSREKCIPTKEMRAALKVIHDSLQKNVSSSAALKNLTSANTIVQKEWFNISSTNKAKPLDVEDYLDCFEELSTNLLQYMVNIMDTNGNTAMHYAVSHGNFDVVSILLDSKVCNVNQINNAGYTCVMLVSLAKLKNSAHRTVVQRMFQMADVNIRAKKHCQTALMLAVSHGNLDMVEMMLAAGADINIQDEDGSTSLMCAAEHGRADIVKHLLSQEDCDSLIQDIDGSTAFKIAWQAGHRDIGLLLYVHEQMLRSKLQDHTSSISARYNNKHFSYQNISQQQPPPPTPPSAPPTE